MATVATACGLCELDCGRQAIARTLEGREIEFCCLGCANVYAILLESGVIASGQNIRETVVFRRSLELGLISNPVATRETSAALDPDAATEEILLQVGGMWCSACSWLIERALNELPGVSSAEVFFASDLAKVKYCPQYLPPDAISARIEQLGYRATEYGGDEAAGRSDLHDLVLRLGIAAFLWANIMAFSVILYVSYFEQIAASASRTLPWVLFALTTPMIFYCAYPILRSAAIGLRNRQIRMEVLLALGIITAYTLSIAQTLRGQTHVYFDTAAAIVTLVLTGKLIERSAKDRAARSIAMLYRLMPKKVRIADQSGEHFVSIDALQPGMLFVVKAGERVPADGIVVEGETQIDESLLTGESIPINKVVTDIVVSGSMNAGSPIRVRALRTGDDSALVQIIRLVERALSSRAPIERTVDRVSRIFVPAVILLAAVIFVVMIATHTAIGVAALRATSILVIACPCALGLATPLAITTALGRAAQHGILISDSRILESMGNIDTVLLDKTGTVTQGDFRLLQFALAREDSDSHERFLNQHLPLLAGVELASEHLLGRAVVQFAQELCASPLEVEAVEICKGKGISAIYDGRRIFIGNRGMAHEAQAVLRPELETHALNWQQRGYTVAYFGEDHELLGVFGFGDRVKDGAAEMVRNLRKRGLAMKLVSGDSALTTSSVAKEIGVDDFIAEATPAMKAAIVQNLQQHGRKVAIIGDGVNDAPALAQADLGIALGTGADIAMSAAPMVLVSGSLEKVDEAFRLASRTTRVVRQNLFWAFFYNICGLTLGIVGLLNPIVAAGAMLLSSSSVVANSMRLSRKFSPDSNRAQG